MDSYVKRKKQHNLLFMTKISVFHPSNKSEISNFNLLEARWWIIEMVIELEFKINELIIEYFKPWNKESFYEIMLNSSILHLGWKLKVLHSAKIIDKKTLDNLRKLFAIRDAFVHSVVYRDWTMIFDEESGSHKMESVINIISVMDSNWVVTKNNAKEYMERFLTLLKEIQILLYK